jgi:hypothetical protein
LGSTAGCGRNPLTFEALSNGEVRQSEESCLRTKLIAKAVVAATALSIAATSGVAEARPKRKVWECPTHSGVRRNANNGMLIGAVGGGLAGNVIGKNTTGTLVGAGVGAVAGHEIAKNRARNKGCHYVYR